jgi:hypothetical protein
MNEGDRNFGPHRAGRRLRVRHHGLVLARRWGSFAEWVTELPALQSGR